MDDLPTPFRCLAGLVDDAAADAEWVRTARFWTGTITLAVGDDRVALRLVDGAIEAIEPVEPDVRPGGGPTDVSLDVPADAWPGMLDTVPRPFLQDWMAARRHGVRIGGSVETFYQYYPALRRLLELFRAAAANHGAPA